MVQADPLNAQRRFCSRTLAKMIRLCAQLRYVQQKVLPADERWLRLIPASDQPTAPPPDPGAPGGLQPPYGALMEAVVAKTNEAEVEEQLRATAAETDGGLQAALDAFMHVLLVRASVSQYHTEVLLDRYHHALAKVMASVWPRLLELLRWRSLQRLPTAVAATTCTCTQRATVIGPPQLMAPRVQVNEETSAGTAESTALDIAAKVWQCNSLRANLTIGRYVSSGLMRVQDVLDWAFTPAPASAVAVPKLVDADEGTATAALECILALLTALLDQAEVCRPRFSCMWPCQHAMRRPPSPPPTPGRCCISSRIPHSPFEPTTGGHAWPQQGRGAL